MDPKIFRQQLEQLAQLQDRKPARGPSHRPAIEYITETDELGEEYQRAVEIKDNPTLGFDLVRIKPNIRACELNCGDIVTDQIIERRFATTPIPHWRTRCNNCQCFVSPDGQGFIQGAHAIQAAYLKYFNMDRKKKTLEVSVEDSQIRSVSQGENYNGEYTETVTNNSIIRRYK